MDNKKTRTLCLLTLLLVCFFANTVSQHPPLQRVASTPVLSDPLGRFQGNGIPVGISWTGDGQWIANPSFETGSLYLRKRHQRSSKQYCGRIHYSGEGQYWAVGGN